MCGETVIQVNYGKVFAYAQATLCFGASIGYALQQHPRMALYWFLAGCITIVVTYGQ